MHVLVRDATDVDCAQVLRDVAERPLFRDIRSRPNWARPDDAIHIILLCVVEKTVPPWTERGDLFPL